MGSHAYTAFRPFLDLAASPARNSSLHAHITSSYINVAPLGPLMARGLFRAFRAFRTLYSFLLLHTIRQALFRLFTSPRPCHIPGPTSHSPHRVPATFQDRLIYTLTYRAWTFKANPRIALNLIKALMMPLNFKFKIEAIFMLLSCLSNKSHYSTQHIAIYMPIHSILWPIYRVRGKFSAHTIFYKIFFKFIHKWKLSV